ncbi:hypothetical protein ACOME3_001695 [Neoechinorhynchus agilis]
MRKSPTTLNNGLRTQSAMAKIRVRLIETYRILFDTSDANGHYVVLCLVIVYFFASVGFWSSTMFTYLYLKLPPLNLNDSEIGIFKGVNSAANGAGLIIILPILKVWFNIKDSMLMLLGFCSACVYLTMICFIKSRSWIFAACLFSLGTTLDAPSIRSLISRQVQMDQEGRAIGLVSSAQSLAYFVSVLFMPPLYKWSIKTPLPGLIFIVGAVLNLIAIVIIGVCIKTGIIVEEEERRNEVHPGHNTVSSS